MKVVLVTGCSTGIGLSTATLFSEGDYQVIATARSPESSEAVSYTHLTLPTKA